MTYVRYKGICWKVEIEKLNTTDNTTAPVLTNQKHPAWHALEGGPGARRSIWLVLVLFQFKPRVVLKEDCLLSFHKLCIHMEEDTDDISNCIRNSSDIGKV